MCQLCPTTDPTWYCSKECAKEDFKTNHKVYCKMVRFYAATRDIKFTTEVMNLGAGPLQESDEIAARKCWTVCTSLRLRMPKWYLRYLRDIPLDKRPVRMLGDPFADNDDNQPHTALLVPPIPKAVLRIRSTMMPSAHQAGAVFLQKASKEVPESKLPLDYRVCFHENGRRGVRLYADDFLSVPAGAFRSFWPARSQPVFDLWDGECRLVEMLKETFMADGATMGFMFSKDHGRCLLWAFHHGGFRPQGRGT